MYTDSRYAFATAHIHGEIYRRRGLLTSEGKDIKNKAEILALLQAIHLRQALSIVHCPGHQKGDSLVARGNRMVDWAAKAAANKVEQAEEMMTCSTPGHNHENPSWTYTEEEIHILREMGAQEDPETGRWTHQGKVVIPVKEGRYLISHLHRFTHLSYQKMKKLLEREEETYLFLQKDKILKEITEHCDACARVNASKIKLSPGTRTQGHRPGTHWEVDFTEIKPGKYGYKYLLVFIYIFQGGQKRSLRSMRLLPWWLKSCWRRSFPDTGCHR